MFLKVRYKDDYHFYRKTFVIDGPGTLILGVSNKPNGANPRVAYFLPEPEPDFSAELHRLGITDRSTGLPKTTLTLPCEPNKNLFVVLASCSMRQEVLDSQIAYYLSEALTWLITANYACKDGEEVTKTILHTNKITEQLITELSNQLKTYQIDNFLQLLDIWSEILPGSSSIDTKAQ